MNRPWMRLFEVSPTINIGPPPAKGPLVKIVTVTPSGRFTCPNPLPVKAIVVAVAGLALTQRRMREFPVSATNSVPFESIVIPCGFLT